jgi:DNA-binding CsgD family transcriptional regulator
LSVFAYPIEHVRNKDYLSLRVQSVLKLRTESLKKTSPGSLKENYLQNTNTKDLSRFVLELDQKVEVLLRVKDRIEALYNSVDNPARTELLSIVNAIKKSASDKKIWDDFKLYFEDSNPNFLLELAKKHPSLTPKDLKYCCYLKMNLSNDDIRNLLGINQESVRTHKYRLKKKMDLPKSTDLINYLRSVENPFQVTNGIH